MDGGNIQCLPVIELLHIYLSTPSHVSHTAAGWTGILLPDENSNDSVERKQLTEGQVYINECNLFHMCIMLVIK